MPLWLSESDVHSSLPMSDLISAMERNGSAPRPFESAAAGHNKPPPKYLRVSVDANDGDEGPTKVNIRVPMQLLRAGVKLASLVPPRALNHANEALSRKGVDVDLTQIKPTDIQELIDQLGDMTIDVEQPDVKVKISCE